jgi:L-lactate dehydrogenase complex protein LldG
MGTDAARAAIFARIRTARQAWPTPVHAASDAGSDASSGAVDAAARDFSRATPAPRPVSGGDLIARFAGQAQAMAVTLETVATLDAVPLAVAQYLDRLGIVRQAIVWPSLQGLPWLAADMTVACRAPQVSDAVGITGVFCALAETGSLMLLPDAHNRASVSLLPETHIAILPHSRIVPDMEAAFDLMRQEMGQLPRSTQIISGPSRTGDIEQTIVLGAHGPYRVHVLLLADG